MTGTNKGGFQWHNWNFKTGYKPIQWRAPASAPLCGFCNKTVYPAEEVVAAGQKFHKLCFKCSRIFLRFIIIWFTFSLASCNTLLNLSNLNEHEKKIYCVSCYRRQFGPRSGRGWGSTLSLNVHTPPASPRLNRIETNVDNHCHERKTSIDSSQSHTSSDDDYGSYSHHIQKFTYLDKITLQKFNSRPSSTNSIGFKMMPTSKNICPRCSKTVYSAEQIKAAGRVK
jgi:predicted nucleic-acid-binding Zn-ribbon protein